METATRLNDIREYYFSAKLRAIDAMNKAGKKVINLGIGSPDLPPHPAVIAALNSSSQAPENHGYQSYKGIPALRQAVACWYRDQYQATINPETEILPMMGSKEALTHICMTYLNPGDKVLIPNPGYPTYRSAVSLAGGIGVDYDLSEANNFEPDFEQLNRVNKNEYKIMFVNFPHMPTGKRLSRAGFEELVRFAIAKNILLVHDNPYSFILNEQPFSIMNIAGAKDCTIELNSLSKSHNMAGWRMGFMIASGQKIMDVLRFKSNMDSGMFLPLQLAAVKALSLDQEWYNTLNNEYRKRKEQAKIIFDQLKCTYTNDQSGMFLWGRVPGHYADGFRLSDEILKRHQIFITPGGIFGSNGDKYIRISLCSPVAVLEEALERIGLHETVT